MVNLVIGSTVLGQVIHTQQENTASSTPAHIWAGQLTAAVINTVLVCVAVTVAGLQWEQYYSVAVAGLQWEQYYSVAVAGLQWEQYYSVAVAGLQWEQYYSEAVCCSWLAVGTILQCSCLVSTVPKYTHVAAVALTPSTTQRHECIINV